MNNTKRLIELLREVLVVAQALTTPAKHPAKPVARPRGRSNATDFGTGIYLNQSRYNPFRVYAHDPKTVGQSPVYLGAFPSLNQAKAARRDFLAGRTVNGGTKARKVVSPRMFLVA
jgi:hypothetical protein